MVLARALLAVVVCALPALARADRATTRDALDRLEELLEMRLGDGTLERKELTPALVVSTQARYEESEGWFAAEALGSLVEVLGAEDLRLCEACMIPRVTTEGGRLQYAVGPLGLDEIARLDASARGDRPPARAAIWLDEHAAGVSIRVVEIGSGRLIYAENVDPSLREHAQTMEMMRRSEELERRARGDSLTHTFVDIGILPSQHISLDWTDQWGETNANFTGVTLAVFDPVIGLGMSYYRVVGVFDIAGFRFAPQVGGKLIVSLPTAIVRGIAPDDVGDLIDPLLTGVLVARMPLGGSNYALVGTASTNLRFTVGISLLNISFLPVIP